MPGTFVYNPATGGAIYCTGGTVGAPADLPSLYAADLAGTIDLSTRTGIAATDGAPVNVTIALRPCEMVVLGPARLGLVVSNWTGLTSATIRIFGTDAGGGAIWEDIVVTANGNYPVTLYYATVTSTQVMAFVGTGSFDYLLRQYRWGLVWQLYPALPLAVPLYYINGATVQALFFGDGTTACYFTSLSETLWAPSLTLVIHVNSTLQIGSNPQQFSLQSPHWRFASISQNNSGSTLLVYNATLDLIGTQGLSAQTIDIRNVHFYSTNYFQIFGITSCNLERVTVFWCQQSGPRFTAGVNPTISDMLIVQIAPAYSLYNASGGTYNYRGCRWSVQTPPATSIRVSAGTVNLTDCVISYATWLIYGTLYSKSTFNLTVVDAAGDPVEGATVRVIRADDSDAFTAVETGSDGKITAQTVTWQSIIGGNLTAFNPMTLEVSCPGFETLVMPGITMDVPTSLVVELQRYQLPWILEVPHNV